MVHYNVYTVVTYPYSPKLLVIDIMYGTIVIYGILPNKVSHDEKFEVEQYHAFLVPAGSRPSYKAFTQKIGLYFILFSVNISQLTPVPQSMLIAK